MDVLAWKWARRSFPARVGAGEVVPILAFLLSATFCGVEEELTALL